MRLYPHVPGNPNDWTTWSPNWLYRAELEAVRVRSNAMGGVYPHAGNRAIFPRAATIPRMARKLAPQKINPAPKIQQRRERRGNIGERAGGEDSSRGGQLFAWYVAEREDRQRATKACVEFHR